MPVSGSREASSATTSPVSTWPGSRSPCAGSTTSCCDCGTPRSAPPACGGVPDMDAALARAWVAAVAASVTSHAADLSDLDAAIGDGDHGVNLRRGFDAAVAALAAFEADTAGAVLTKTGTTLVSKVGGASGPLYGSLFRALGKE